MHTRNILIIIIVLFIIVLNACQKENTFSGTNPQISTSLDTLTFDTVFTAVGSATRSFKIYNNEMKNELI